MSRPHACGVLYGLKTGHLRRPGLLYRAALEAVTLSLYRGYTRMQACGYPAPDYIGLVGGGASNPLWRQLIADVFQMPVSVVYSGVEGGRYCGYIGALGAAFQALAVALGEDVASFANRQCGELERAGALAEGTAPSDPRPELGPVYRALFERRVALEDLLAGAQGWA
jgi:xylulokinase